MDMNNVYQSKFLKASDLQGREVNAVIDSVTMEEVGQDAETKPCLFFKGKAKGMVMNKTNSNNLVSAFGSETDEWEGKSVTLYTTFVDFQGKSVEAIRVRAARGAAPAKGNKGKPAPAAEPLLDDDIPF